MRRAVRLTTGFLVVLAAAALVVSLANRSTSPPRPDYAVDWGVNDPFVNVFHPERISVVPDPAGLDRRVAEFTVTSADTGPTADPRAQMELPRFLHDGQEIWQGLSFYLPYDFPTEVPSGGFVTHTEFYGPPYGGTPPISFGSYAGEYRFGARLFGSGTYAWSFVPARGRWHDIVIHMRIGADGFLEMWHNGVKQPMANTGPGGTFGAVSADGTRWIGATMDPDLAAPPLDSRLALYVDREMADRSGPLSIYFGPARWKIPRPGEREADSLAAVDPQFRH